MATNGIKRVVYNPWATTDVATDSPDSLTEVRLFLNQYKQDQKIVMETNGIKYDKEKTRVDLLDAEWMTSVGDVLTFGAKKYTQDNWRGGISYSRLIGAALRHLFAIMRGEDIDPESGLPHVSHLSCCAMFLFSMMRHRSDLDDRYKYETFTAQ